MGSLGTAIDLRIAKRKHRINQLCHATKEVLNLSPRIQEKIKVLNGEIELLLRGIHSIPGANTRANAGELLKESTPPRPRKSAAELTQQSEKVAPEDYDRWLDFWRLDSAKEDLSRQLDDFDDDSTVEI